MEGSYELIAGSNNPFVTLSSHLLVIRSKDVIVSISPDTANGVSLFHPTFQKYYELGRTGSRIWELIQEPVTVGQVVSELLDEYEIDRLTCEAEVFSFLAKLSEQKLIWFGM